jgi:nitrile hydratase
VEEMPIAERLRMHRAVWAWLKWQLGQEERTIRDLELREAEEKRRREVARRESRWVIQASRAAEGHPMLHRGGCSLGARHGADELLDRDGVVSAAERYPDLEMCDVCAPWGGLGINKPSPRPAAINTEDP